MVFLDPLQFLLRLTPALELGPNGGEFGLVQIAGETGVEVGNQLLGAVPVLFFEADFEESEKGVGSGIAGVFQRGAEPMVGLDGIIQLEKKIAEGDGGIAGGADAEDIEKRVDGVAVVAAALFHSGEGLPAGSVVEIVDDVEAVVGGGVFEIVGGFEGLGGEEEKVVALGGEFGGFGEVGGGLAGIIIAGVGEGEKLDDIETAGIRLVDFFQDADRLGGLAGVEMCLRFAKLFFYGLVWTGAGGREKKENRQKKLKD